MTGWVLQTEFETITDVCQFRSSEVLLMIIILWSLNWHGVCLGVLKRMQHKWTREFWLRAKSIADQSKAGSCLYYVIILRLALNTIEIYFEFVHGLSSYFTAFTSSY